MTMVNYQEAFRPQYHFTPMNQWMNDPNGMVYYEGEYHLFYQYHPESTVWGPMHWGHAVSRDLIHWEQLPIALAPDHNGCIFSGSAVVDTHDTTGFFAGGQGLVAIFTHADAVPDSDRSRQTQSVAYSLDKGRTWIKYAGNPVLIEEDIEDFRDPKVFWYAPRNSWVMVIAVGDHVRFYQSPNLLEWSFTGEFGKEEGSHEGVWECPDLFPLPVNDSAEPTNTWVLIVSIGDHHEYEEGSRTQYFIGEFDGCTFVNDYSPETILWLDHGRDNYAGVTWSDIPQEDGRRIFMGWMSNWKYASTTPTSEWRGAMTLPRELSLICEPEEGIRLVQKPAEELCCVRQQPWRWENLLLSPDDDAISFMEGELLEIEAEFELEGATEFGFKLRASQEEGTVIGYDCVQQSLFIDRCHSGQTDFHEQFPCRHSAQLKPMNKRIQLHIFLDWSSVEVFANGGRLVMTDQIFPSASSIGLKPYALGGHSKLIALSVHPLRSVYSGHPSAVGTK